MVAIEKVLGLKTNSTLRNLENDVEQAFIETVKCRNRGGLNSIEYINLKTILKIAQDDLYDFCAKNGLETDYLTNSY